MMNDINSIYLEGKVKNDPRWIGNGTRKEAAFALASKRYEETLCIPVICQDGLADKAARIIKKNLKVRALGRLEQRSTIEDGKERAYFVIVPEHLEYKQNGKSNTIARDE